MGRTRVRRRRLAVILTAAVVAGAWAGPLARALGPRAEAVPASDASCVVREGDTLWSIAERLSPGQDPRPLVDAISAANGVQAEALMPGQALLIPSAG